MKRPDHLSLDLIQLNFQDDSFEELLDVEKVFGEALAAPPWIASSPHDRLAFLQRLEFGEGVLSDSSINRYVALNWSICTTFAGHGVKHRARVHIQAATSSWYLAFLHHKNGNIYLTDCGSKGAILVNNKALARFRPILLKDRAIIQCPRDCCSYLFRFSKTRSHVERSLGGELGHASTNSKDLQVIVNTHLNECLAYQLHDAKSGRRVPSDSTDRKRSITPLERRGQTKRARSWKLPHVERGHSNPSHCEYDSEHSVASAPSTSVLADGSGDLGIEQGSHIGETPSEIQYEQVDSISGKEGLGKVCRVAFSDKIDLIGYSTPDASPTEQVETCSGGKSSALGGVLSRLLNLTGNITKTTLKKSSTKNSCLAVDELSDMLEQKLANRVEVSATVSALTDGGIESYSSRTSHRPSLSPSGSQHTIPFKDRSIFQASTTQRPKIDSTVLYTGHQPSNSLASFNVSTAESGAAKPELDSKDLYFLQQSCVSK